MNSLSPPPLIRQKISHQIVFSNDVIDNQSSSCRSTRTPCVGYRTLSKTTLGAPTILCSILQSCDNNTVLCASSNRVCLSVTSERMIFCKRIILADFSCIGAACPRYNSTDKQWNIINNNRHSRYAHSPSHY